jgi:hypothetical protein
LKIVGSLSKMKPCHRRVPKIGKKTLESCDVQNIEHQVNAVVCPHMKEYKTNGKQQLDNPATRKGSMLTHFQLPPYEYH